MAPCSQREKARLTVGTLTRLQRYALFCASPAFDDSTCGNRPRSERRKSSQQVQISDIDVIPRSVEAQRLLLVTSRLRPFTLAASVSAAFHS